MPNPATIRVRRKGGKPDVYTLNASDWNPALWEIVSEPPLVVSSAPAEQPETKAEDEAPKRKRQK